jgi:hypothetical protein
LDELIQAVAKAYKNNHTIVEIRQAILNKGWSEEDTFLAMKAGEILYQTIKQADADKKKPSFKRIP